MENFNQIFSLMAEEDGFTLDPLILESGVINIVGLIVIVVTTAKDSIGAMLRERNKTISENVKDAENRLNEAENRLNDAQKQLNQANVVISKIKSDTLKTKKIMLEADANEAKSDLKFRFEKAMLTFKSKERRIFFEIKEQISLLVIIRTIKRVKETFAQEKSTAKLINNTIRTLELPS